MVALALTAAVSAAELTGTALAVASAGAAIVGGLADSLITQQIFGGRRAEGARVGEFRVQGADEGDGVGHAAGRQVSSAGTVIWVDGPREEAIGAGGGGGGSGGFGGGGSGSPAGFEYYMDLAFLVAEHATMDLIELRAGGDLIWTSAPNTTVTGTITLTPKVATSTAIYNVFRTAELTLSAGDLAAGNTFTGIATGSVVAISGFSNGGNNGSFNVIAVEAGKITIEGSGPLGTDTGTFVSEGPVTVTVEQTLNPELEGIIGELIYYDGTQTTPSPLIEAKEGVGFVPTWPGISYFTIERLRVTPWGGIPQLTAVFRTNADTVDEVVLQIAGRAGLTVDVADLEADFEGCGWVGPLPVDQMLSPVMLGADLLEQEQAGGMRFFPHDEAVPFEIAVEDLGFGDGNSLPGPPIVFDDPRDLGVPETITVNVRNPAKGYDKGSGVARNASRDASENQVLELPLSMTEGNARALAERILARALSEREPLSLSVPFRYKNLRANDLVRFVHDGIGYERRITRAACGQNDRVQIETLPFVRTASLQIPEADEDQDQTETFSVTPAVEALVLEPSGGPSPAPGAGPVPTPQPPTSGPMVILGAENTDPLDFWKKAQIWISDDDDEYLLFGTLEQEAILGRAESVLGTGPLDLWDGANTIDVRLFDPVGVLASRTDSEIYNGRNIFATATGEVFQARDVTALGDGLWRLSRLLRGRFDTGGKMGDHIAGELVAWLGGGGFTQAGFPLTELGKTKYWKVVPPGKDLASVQARQLTLEGRSVAPWAPSHPQAARDPNGAGSGDASATTLLSWMRRTRLLAGSWANPRPLVEPFEAYDVRIIYPTGSGLVVAERTITGETSYEYSNTQMDADGFSSVFHGFQWQVRQRGNLKHGDWTDLAEVAAV